MSRISAVLFYHLWPEKTINEFFGIMQPDLMGWTNHIIPAQSLPPPSLGSRLRGNDVG